MKNESLLDSVSLNKLQAEEKMLLLEEAKLANVKKKREEVQEAINLMEFYYEISSKANGPLSTPQSKMICSFFAKFPIFSLLEGQARMEHWASRYSTDSDRDKNVKFEMDNKPMALSRKKVFIEQFFKDKPSKAEVSNESQASLRQSSVNESVSVS